jgi:deferrochelatase/peroxidase EfeB
MMNGLPVGRYGAVNGSYDAPPDDTGDALDLPPSGLTITIGFGPTLFRMKDGTARFGIADRQPDTLHELPRFPGDMLDESICGGDICIQACADDAQVAVHAVRNLVRLAFGSAAVRWSQMGYGKSSSTSHDQPTPRNLFGFKDGTRNITGDDTAGLDSFVWVQPEDAPAWMQGGTYLAVRKIRMTIETWDRSSMREQEATFGRTKKEGAPLSGGSEFTDPDFTVQGRDAVLLIDPTSHMALAHPDSNDGNRILRRAYNYTDGSDGLGRLDAGLFFLSYQRDIDRQFTPMQMRLSRSDRMNEYVKYLSSATFAIPPGCMTPDDYIGRTLLEG